VIWQPAIALVNGRVVTEHGLSDAVRFTSRILSVGEAPKSSDIVVDVRDSFVLPGLINAHDHLELNHYGRLKFRERYCNVSEWIDDMRPRLADDGAIRAARSRPLNDRLFVGALKNLLSGVTTVVHHNPFYRELRRGMPIRVLRRYGWAHSFFLQDRPAGAKGEAGGDVQDRFRSTRADSPFFVHLGEGIDANAHAELGRLEAIGCLGANTVLVHGVAIDVAGWRRVARAQAGAVWCPASNNFLFGQTIDFGRVKTARMPHRIALGTDSRLTGSRDLLEELRIAYESSSVPRDGLLPMVTTTAADLIRQPQLGRIRPGAPADLIVVPRVADDPVDALLATSRRDLELVAVGGRPLVAVPMFAKLFDGLRVTPPFLDVDSARKLIDPALAKRIAACAIAEPGVVAP
jgi:cytosine/adenosine deaminase-related metal-dependent hydrolase